MKKTEFCDKNQLPKDVLLGDSIVEILGRRSVFLENYVLINELCEEKIVVKCKHYYITILGQQLNIEYYNNRICMEIVGEINEILFHRSLH